MLQDLCRAGSGKSRIIGHLDECDAFENGLSRKTYIFSRLT